MYITKTVCREQNKITLIFCMRTMSLKKQSVLPHRHCQLYCTHCHRQLAFNAEVNGLFVIDNP